MYTITFVGPQAGAGHLIAGVRGDVLALYLSRWACTLVICTQ